MNTPAYAASQDSMLDDYQPAHGDDGLPSSATSVAQSPSTRDAAGLGRTRAASGASARLSPSTGAGHIAKQSLDTLERKSSLSYSHHRRASIVHGVQQPGHAQYPSVSSSTATSNSPRSPQVGFSPLAKETGLFPVNRSPSFSTPGTIKGLRKSPSTSTVASGAPSYAPAANDPYSTVRRPERMHSARARQRSHSQQAPLSVLQSQPELTTVGEYALHHLLTNFIKEADDRIDRCMSDANDANVNIEAICGQGADLGFDQLIKALGHIGRQRPKSLIDSVMIWRRGKGDITAQYYSDLQRVRSSSISSTGATSVNSRQHQNSPNHSVQGGSISLAAGVDHTRVSELEMHVRNSEKRSAISVYILCRVLMEIISQCIPGSLPEDTANRLEDVIWVQVRNADPDTLHTSMIRQAQWTMFGQLLGVMSGPRFDRVTDRYLSELGTAQLKLGVKGHSESELERKAALLVQNMRWLKLRVAPDDVWDQSCTFLTVLAGYFVNVHGKETKNAYCQLLEDLLLPIASIASHQLENHRWTQFLDITKNKVTRLLLKPKYWSHAFPLQTMLLCTSPIDQFSQQWLQMALGLQPKLKDRITRSHALKALCRLVWRYLYRTSDKDPSKKLDEIMKMLLQVGRKSIISTEPSIADPLIQLIRIIAFKCQEYCFRCVIFPLMNAELILSSTDLKIETLEPERMVIAIRAFLAIMSDFETKKPPAFPLDFECDVLLDPYSQSPHARRRPPSRDSHKRGSRMNRLSKPVLTTDFAEMTKEFYNTSCKVLGRITVICDNAFGGQAVLDEKFGQSAGSRGGMSEAFVFGRREDTFVPGDVRQGFYDLLHVAVQALPRCLSPHIPFLPPINLLCTGTAHVQNHIASSSAQSLKSIARERHAQQVTTSFASFIFNFDDRYATVADGGLLGAQHIESTLRLYVELLEIWIEDLQTTTKSHKSDSAEQPNKSALSDMNVTRVFAHVDEIESHGLFFLCSPSKHVRAFALRVLRLVNKFDHALGQPSTRIISILENNAEQLMQGNEDNLTVAERSRLQTRRSADANHTLIELCNSDVAQDSALWLKMFPSIISLSQKTCPQAVLLTRDIVCRRLLHSQDTIRRLSDPIPETTLGGRIGTRPISSTSDVTIDQWKLHLMFACTTLTNPGIKGSLSSQGAAHSRTNSKASSTEHDKITTATDLFERTVPFLAAGNDRVRNAAAVGLGSISPTLYCALHDSIQYLVAECNVDAKVRLGAVQRSAHSPKITRRNDDLRTALTHLLRLTAHCLSDEEILGDEKIIQNLATFTKEMRIFLNDEHVQNQWGYQKLRTYYCGLIEAAYKATRRADNATSWMPFLSRKATFSMMEDWCGYSPSQAQTGSKDDRIRRTPLEKVQDHSYKGVITAVMEIERRDLRVAALSAMAALCAGPLSVKVENQASLQFDKARMLRWIENIFVDTQSDKAHATGRRALTNLIKHNQTHTSLLGRSVEMCYLAKSPKALWSYFEVVTNVLTEEETESVPFWKVICVGLYTLGNEKSEVRMKSARLLRTLETRFQIDSRLQDLDISVSDRTTAVYKLAQYQISQRLSKQHAALAFHVFSEFSIYFKELSPDHQRNLVSAMLPWMQTMELQVDTSGNPTATSHMLLVNLFEITVRSSHALHHEIQALWQALATGPHGGNVQVVLDFIITVCLDRREQNFVEYAKQVSVFLSGTPAGSKVVDFLFLQLTPRSMVAEKTDPPTVPHNVVGLPYIADLAQALPAGNKQTGLSLGQLCLMLLVDLVVSPIQLPRERVPVLLQTILTQWDHYNTLVQDNAREMLVHLIHELVISKMEPDSLVEDKVSTEGLIESVRRHEVKVAWSYDANLAGTEAMDGIGVPDAMAHVVEQALKAFAITYKASEYDIRLRWAKVSLEWATSCPVRHIACRSFQIYRCILQGQDHESVDQEMLADMLARLSNTIADDGNDYITFSQEILITLRTFIGLLEPVHVIEYPQLFWVTAACLETTFESEFREGLMMLEQLLDRLDLSDPAVTKLYLEHKPAHWEGEFRGLQPLVYQGLRSSMCFDRSLALMERMVTTPSTELVGDESRLLFTILAKLPELLSFFDDQNEFTACLRSAETLVPTCDEYGFQKLGRVLERFSRGMYGIEDSFVTEIITVVREAFFPRLEFDSLVFLIGLLNNQLSRIKVKTMRVLCAILPDVDMRKPDIASQGPDLISPVLRLLQTNHCQQALEVLDNVMLMTGTTLDHKHIRMSMAGSHSSRATRKEYESTRSLYGIPEESGWSVPMPAVYSARTRHNVQAVVRTCAKTSGEPYTGYVGTPKIEFTDDQNYRGYFGGNDRDVELPMSATSRGDGSMSELVMKLDSLDDFFDDHDHAVPHEENIPMYSANLHDNRETLYDKQTLPILHKSLNRSASITSFHTGFADPRYTSSRDGSTSTAVSKAGPVRLRPTLHTRSSTSPAVPAQSDKTAIPQRRQDHYFSADETGDEREPFSDDDGRSTSIDDTISSRADGTRSATSAKNIYSGLRSGMRRLRTGHHTGSTSPGIVSAPTAERDEPFGYGRHAVSTGHGPGAGYAPSGSAVRGLGIASATTVSPAPKSPKIHKQQSGNIWRNGYGARPMPDNEDMI